LSWYCHQSAWLDVHKVAECLPSHTAHFLQAKHRSR
jgi:hypothetical protein